MTGNGTAFSQCRFHFGTVDAIARANPSMIPQLDFYTPGWMASISDTFDMQYVCNDTKAGGTFANQVPVIVAYAAAFYVKRHAGLSTATHARLDRRSLPPGRGARSRRTSPRS